MTVCVCVRVSGGTVWMGKRKTGSAERAEEFRFYDVAFLIIYARNDFS